MSINANTTNPSPNPEPTNVTSSNPTQNDEFYIGYASQIPPGIFKFLVVLIPILLLIVITFAVILPRVLNQYNPGTLGPAPAFQGILMDKPVPHLMVPRLGDTSKADPYSRYVLAAFNKAGFSPQILDELSGEWVEMPGTATYRNHFMLLLAGQAEAIDPPAGQSLDVPPGKPLGEFTLVGEILDSKCYPGVMKPGQSAVHRSCAIRCISGGVPPSLRVENAVGDVMYFFMVDRKGEAINQKILDIVAAPVEVTGEVVQYGDLFILQADREEYRLI